MAGRPVGGGGGGGNMEECMKFSGKFSLKAEERVGEEEREGEGGWERAKCCCVAWLLRLRFDVRWRSVRRDWGRGTVQAQPNEIIDSGRE